MKKFIFLLLIICPIFSYGQIKNSSPTIRTEVLSKYTNTIELEYNEVDENYYINFLSTNQFDSRPFICLGDYEESMITLDFFVDKMNSLYKGESFQATVGSKTILFTLEKYFGTCLIFSDKHQAGISYMHKNGLLRFAKEIVDHHTRVEAANKL